MIRKLKDQGVFQENLTEAELLMQTDPCTLRTAGCLDPYDHVRSWQLWTAASEALEVQRKAWSSDMNWIICGPNSICRPS